ncbi:MAG: hypothetical protein ABMA64_38650 [Myxococcota bacterium]
MTPARAWAAVIGLIFGFSAGRWLSPSPPEERAGVAPNRWRCATPTTRPALGWVTPIERHTPDGWDALAEERAWWEDEARWGGGEPLAVDCSRYPCLAQIAWRGDGPAMFASIEQVKAGSPTAEVTGMQTFAEGWSTATVVGWNEAPTDPASREVRLRRLGFDLEREGLTPGWLDDAP